MDALHRDGVPGAEVLGEEVDPQLLDHPAHVAGGGAHDMNNVLAAILGMASLLQIKREGDELLVKSLRTIENAAGRGRARRSGER